MSEYSEFIAAKSQLGGQHGFEPTFIPPMLFDFQRALVEWSVRKGRAAIFADCGLGKTPMALTWAQNVVERTNGRVLILTPLAVGAQFAAEAEKFGIEATRTACELGGAGIYITNYEKLHRFDSGNFVAVIADESSILKHFTGETQKQVTRFALKLRYRLLDTATAAPNDYIELGTSAEALGELGYSDMLSRFFRQTDNKSQFNDIKASREDRAIAERGGNYFGKLAFRAAQTFGQWRMKGHAEVPFWRWVASWARACRKPSDLGFDDGPMILPPLEEREHEVVPTRPADGMLFTVPAFGLKEERDERRRTLNERCELAARLVNHSDPAVVWCHMNDEGNALERMIPGSVQVAGSDSDESKEEKFKAFLSGQARVLVTKPKIGAWGLNFQHCAHVVTFASHSFEQYYQSVRRCWRFGQTRPVRVDIISTTGEVHVRESMRRKSAAADVMYDRLVAFMREAQTIDRMRTGAHNIEVPQWA